MASRSETPAAPSPLATDRRLLAAGGLAAPLVVIALVHFGLGARGAISAFFVAVLALLSVIDVAERRLPNVIVLPSLAVVLTAQLAFFPDRRLEWIAATLGAGVFFLLPQLLYPKGLGMGDVKLALLIGAALGAAVVTALLVGTLAAAIVSAAILVRRGRAARKQAIPFGPFLALGAVVALFVHDGLS